MALEDAQVIDVVRNTTEGKIVVVITDDGTVKIPYERTAYLVQKLKSYIYSIVSGDLKRDHPDKTARDFMIEVQCRHRPTPEMTSITQVMPRKDPANTVPVRFVELVKGGWGLERSDAEASLDAQTDAGKPRRIDERLDDLSEAALTKSAEVAENYLQEGERGFYFAVLGWEQDKTEVIYFRENSVTEAIRREVDQYVRGLAVAFTVCVVAGVGNLKKFKQGDKEAVLLALHRRGHQMARVYAMPIRHKGVFHKQAAAGELGLVGSKTGLFPF